MNEGQRVDTTAAIILAPTTVLPKAVVAASTP